MNAENSDLYFTIIIFIFFLSYGFSNLYIIVFLRRKENHVVSLLEFIALFMGNIKNYINMNKRFKQRFLLDNNFVFFNRCILIMHLISPVLIIISIISWVFSIGFYWFNHCWENRARIQSNEDSERGILWRCAEYQYFSCCRYLLSWIKNLK
jgi:hypothetical protein